MVKFLPVVDATISYARATSPTRRFNCGILTRGCHFKFSEALGDAFGCSLFLRIAKYSQVLVGVTSAGGFILITQIKYTSGMSKITDYSLLFIQVR